jgi:hypothetical protein
MLVPAIGRWRSNTDTAMVGSWEGEVRASPSLAPAAIRSLPALGLKCCSPECERRYRERQEVIKGPETKPKRTCEVCGKRIPRYTTTGRATKATVRHCSTGVP